VSALNDGRSTRQIWLKLSLHFPAVAWHPTHNTLLTSGGMDGALFHWVLDSAEPIKPVSTVQYAHDQVIWTLDYHPLGYVLASGSKDFSTRFWCRARPAGGQERDRWHVGESASQQFGTWKQQVDDDDQGERMMGDSRTLSSSIQY
jgi:polyadenylation factor subunit 2